MASDVPFSDSGSSQAPGTKRTPKVGVYIPRHRRGNDDPSSPGEPSEPKQTSTNSTPRQQSASKPHRKAGSGKENSAEDITSRPTGSSNGEVQRRGRGKFMGPGGNSEGSGSPRNPKGSNHRSTSNSSSSTTSSSPSQQSPTITATQTAPRPPRGRDFDATVLRRYSDDEGKPNTTYSRSSSFSSGRSYNNSSVGGSAYSPNTRSSGRPQESSGTRRSDRAEEGSWRREEPKRTEDQESEQAATTNPDDETNAASLSSRLDRIQLSEDSQKEYDGAGSAEELEEWELALQNSDDDGIPGTENTKPKPTKSHPAEHLRNPGTSKVSKTGASTEVPTEDFYIIELYDFSPSIKTAHLTDMFAAFENRSGGFRIKWIDDTKALAIFESASVAKQAYTANLTNEIARIRPYSGTDKDTIRSAEGPSGGAYNGARPAKTDSVARRLVHGALGLRVRRTPEQIAEEKALVQAAKEARELQRQEQQRQRQEMDAIFDS